uniref:Major facilitator superfamily (MFS) profile domain-containing protein n=1 Tax=Panagrolaimus davidi TaxID=227884 RepID=A0A914Q607_9BILA
MRTHIGVAMVCMINATAVQDISAKENPKMAQIRINQELHPECKPLKIVKDETANKGGYHGSFVWSIEKQSIIFSASFYGNLGIMCFSGFFVDHFGPKIVALIAVAGMSAVTLLSPTIAYYNYYDFVVLRIVFGVFENSYYPTMSAMASRWFPASERSTVSAIFLAGTQLATSLGIVIASELCTLEKIFGGWPLIFYLAGILGIVWIIFWLFWSTDSPTDCKFLSVTEKEYLHEEVGKHLKTSKERKETGQTLPLKQMITSKAILAIMAAQFGFNFSNTLMQTYLPTYFRDVLALDLKRNGLYTALPFVFQLVSQISCGMFADFLKHKEILSPSAACRLFQAFASFGATAIFICIAFYVDCTEHKLALLLLIFYGIATGATTAGSFTASLCVAPMYTGMVTSFMLISISISNTLAPAIVGILVKQGAKLEWSIVFGLTAVLNCLGGSLFLIYGSAKIQRWAIPMERAPVIMVSKCSVPSLPENPNDSIHHLTVK